MHLGLVLERKADFPFAATDPRDIDSELFSSAEEDALLSGLRDAGHQVVRIGDGATLVARPGFWRRRCDLVFNLSVGYRGIDRKSLVPGVLELAGIPYVGSSPYALCLTRHKHHAKLIVADAGIPTAPAKIWSGEEHTASLSAIPYPVIVKPVAESSSIGISRSGSVVGTPGEAADRARWIVETFSQPALVETFVRGLEVEVPLIGHPHPRALGAVAITVDGVAVRGDVHLAVDAVYHDGYGFENPAPGIDREGLMAMAEIAAAALGIRDYGRIDFRVADDGTPYFLEASTHPHIQPHSSFFVLAKSRGLDYPSMLDEIIRVAAARFGL